MQNKIVHRNGTHISSDSRENKINILVKFLCERVFVTLKNDLDREIFVVGNGNIVNGDKNTKRLVAVRVFNIFMHVQYVHQLYDNDLSLHDRHFILAHKLRCVTARVQ